MATIETLAAPLTLAEPPARSQAKRRQGCKKLYRFQALDPAAILATLPLPGHNRPRLFGAGRSEPERGEDRPAMVPPRGGRPSSWPSLPRILEHSQKGPEKAGAATSPLRVPRPPLSLANLTPLRPC